MARARRAGDIPWAFTLGAYPGRTLVRDRAKMEGAARQARGVAPTRRDGENDVLEPSVAVPQATDPIRTWPGPESPKE